MAHVMTLTDNTTTFNLTNGNDCRLLDYEPESPQISAQEAATILVDGGEIINTHVGFVTETARVEIVGSSITDLRANIATVELLFLQARERQKRRNAVDRVYVTLKMDSEADTWRSEILYASLSLTDNVFEEWGNAKAEVLLTWVRRFYWEGSESFVTVSNGTGSGSYINIRNHNDAGTGDDNFVDIDATEIEGILPAACVINFKNKAGTAVNWNNIYIGQAIWTDGANFTHILEGEDNEAAGGTDTANAGSSGGSYHAYTWGSATTYSTPKYAWTISGTQLSYAGGGFFRLLAYFALSPNATTRVKATVGLDGVHTYYESPEIKLKGSGLEDLGVIQLPPSLSELPSGALGALTVYLYARDAAAGSLSIDFVQLTPLDGWRRLNVDGTNFAENSVVVDDGIKGIAYTTEYSVGNYGNIIAEGNPIMLWPGRDQRLYFLFDEDSGINITRETEITISYRPRRLTL